MVFRTAFGRDKKKASEPTKLKKQSSESIQAIEQESSAKYKFILSFLGILAPLVILIDLFWFFFTCLLVPLFITLKFKEEHLGTTIKVLFLVLGALNIGINLLGVFAHMNEFETLIDTFYYLAFFSYFVLLVLFFMVLNIKRPGLSFLIDVFFLTCLLLVILIVAPSLSFFSGQLDPTDPWQHFNWGPFLFIVITLALIVGFIIWVNSYLKKKQGHGITEGYARSHWLARRLERLR